MQLTKSQLWARFQKYNTVHPTLGLSLDISRLNFPDDFFSRMAAPLEKAFGEMDSLEKGAIANPDEKRMVGHYWLRNPSLSPTAEIRRAIEETVVQIKDFTRDVHSGNVKVNDGVFQNILVIGIGGSALGPQFVSAACAQPINDKMKCYFVDNTDPDGIDKVLATLRNQLAQTLCIVTSKSGGTKETRNGMLEVETAYQKAGLTFARHAVAVTGDGSELDNYAKKNSWLRCFPMWDWVGGRTSVTSAVGLLPAALQGLDIDALLAGARECDVLTRAHDIAVNPAARMALMWHYGEDGRGAKDMVVLPYKDRLELFSRYLQQLIMESLGKEKDLDGKVVHQGMAVYGNKGSTDQHAYVQQLREGVHNFFVTFIRVLKDRSGEPYFVEPNVTSGDYLDGFYQGTRQALYENGRESMTITIDAVSAKSVGLLIALFERAVGLYASLVHINAYNQPGVEAGKKAAGTVISLQEKVLRYLQTPNGKKSNPEEIAAGLKLPDEVETILHICEHLAANGRIKQGSGGTYFY